MNQTLVFLGILSLVACAHLLAADNYPTRPIRVVVSSAAGGGTDFVARVLEGPFSEHIKQPMVIDNRGGAGGIVGADIVARSWPDGYTLLMTFVNFSIYPSLHPHLSFDPVKDFAPISILAATPLILVVNPKLPATTVKELIALGRARVVTLSYASPGVGSLGHLAGELFKSMTKIEITHVPYKGGGPSLTATIGGDVQVFFSTMPSALTQIKAGRLRGLAVTSAKRASSAPNIPTVAEFGVPNYDVTGWFGVFAPSSTPRNIIVRLNQAFTKALAAPGITEQFVSSGLEPGGSTPEQFAAMVRSDVSKWTKLVNEAGIRAE